MIELLDQGVKTCWSTTVSFKPWVCKKKNHTLFIYEFYQSIFFAYACVETPWYDQSRAWLLFCIQIPVYWCCNLVYSWLGNCMESARYRYLSNSNNQKVHRRFEAVQLLYWAQIQYLFARHSYDSRFAHLQTKKCFYVVTLETLMGWRNHPTFLKS